MLPKKVTQDPTARVIGIRGKSVPDRGNYICKGGAVRELRAHGRKLELEMAGARGDAGQGHERVGSGRSKAKEGLWCPDVSLKTMQ